MIKNNYAETNMINKNVVNPSICCLIFCFHKNYICTLLIDANDIRKQFTCLNISNVYAIFNMDFCERTIYFLKSKKIHLIYL